MKHILQHSPRVLKPPVGFSDPAPGGYEVFLKIEPDGGALLVTYRTEPDVFALPIRQRLRAVNSSATLLAFIHLLWSFGERLPHVPTREQLERDILVASGVPVPPPPRVGLQFRKHPKTRPSHSRP